MKNLLSGLHFNFFSKLLCLLYLFFFVWWLYIQQLGTQESSVNTWFAAAYSIVPILGAFGGFVTATSWSTVNRELKKAIMAFSFGLLSWGSGEIIWSIYNLFFKIEVPYPSLADVGFMMSLPLWSLGIVFLARGVGIKADVKNRLIKYLVFLLPVVVLIISYYLLFIVIRRADFGPESGLIKLFFDISYPLWDIVLLVLITIINILAFGFIRDRFLKPFIIISLGLLFSFFADLGFSYQSSVGEFYNGGFVDLLFITTNFLVSLGINTLVPEDGNPSINLQTILLKQRDKEIEEVNQKLRERDEMLSRINQEIYKKNLELIEEKRKAEALLYNVTEAVLVIGNDKKITLFNRAAQNLLGVKEEEAKGRLYKDLVSLYDEKGNKLEEDMISQVLLDKVGAKFQNLTLKRIDSRERYVNLAVSKVSVERDSLIVMIISDVTEEIKTEKAREEFISIASHELRTPMTIIKNYLWMLQNKKGGDLSDKQSEYVNKALSGTDRMLKLIHDMLDVSKMEQGKLELHPVEINLYKMIGDITSDFKIRAEQKGIDMRTELDDNLPNIRADEDKLREVIINLVGNSFKFTDQGYVSVRAKVDGNFVKVSIVDTGKGIDVEDIPKLFNKFGRLDNSFVTVAESGGTGLGLYIVKSIIETMGGKVGVFSEGVKKGSTFWFTLRIA